MIELDTDRKPIQFREKTIILLDESEQTNCITVLKILRQGEKLTTAITQSVYPSTDNRA